MTIRNSSLAVAILLSQVLYITAFSQKPSQTPDEELPRVFTKPDGTKVTANVDRYSTSSGIVRVITEAEAGEYIEMPFDKIAPQNQKIILEWKMNQIVQSSDFDVTYTQKKGASDTGYIRGTDIKVDKNAYYYELTIENGGDIPITGLTVEYAIAFKRRQVEGRGLHDPQGGLGYHAITLPVMDIAAKEAKVVITPSITLKNYENVYSGDGVRGEGGGISIEEYAGVLFRFKRNGVTLRDVSNPPGIVNREFTLKPIPDDAAPGSNKIP